MQTIILKVKVNGLESTQAFVDDFAAAARELQYWNSRGDEVEILQFTETSDQCH